MSPLIYSAQRSIPIPDLASWSNLLTSAPCQSNSCRTTELPRAALKCNGVRRSIAEYVEFTSVNLECASSKMIKLWGERNPESRLAGDR